MAGPMVVWMTAFLKKTPLTAAGLALIIASTSAFKFSTTFSVSNETRAIQTCILASLSTRYSTLPALISLIAKAIKEIKAGKVEYRVDKEANMHVCIARVSFDTQKVIENLKALVEAVTKAKPAAVKGTYFKKAVIHTTMGPAIQFTFAGR